LIASVMQASERGVERRRGADVVLMMALVASSLLCLHAVTARLLHPDQMAFGELFHPDKLPFNPGWFEKPPFYTYCNWLVSVVPASGVAAALALSPDQAHILTIVWSRIAMTGLFLASVWLVYLIAREAHGMIAARVTALLFATSAGMVAFVHQLTSDVPVMFWMVLAFFHCVAIVRDGRPAAYGWAGICTGLATATKYNGLGVGVAIVAAHMVRSSAATPAAWKRPATHLPVALGLAAVPVGFVLGNPFAVLDYRTFKADFLYNYVVAPVYEGQSGTSYDVFFARLGELIGAPALVLVGLAAVIALARIVRVRRLDLGAATFWCSLVVCVVYYLKFAPFPRLETRFVLPIVPFVFLLASPGWESLLRRRRGLAAVLAGVVAYNLVCAAWVGRRFQDDPRLAVAAWIDAHVPPGSSIEADMFSPDGAERPELRPTTMPFVTGRERLFAEVFPGNRFVLGSEEVQRKHEAQVDWFSAAELRRRDPDFLVVSSLYYERFLEPGRRRDLYPSIHAYFEDLLAEHTPYRIVLDRHSSAVPWWIYPRAIDFLDGRSTVLAKADEATSVVPDVMRDVEGREVEVVGLARDRHLVFVTLKATSCPICRVQLQRLGRLVGHFRACGASFVVLAPGSAAALTSVARATGFPYPFVSDPTLAIATAAGFAMPPDQLVPGFFVVNAAREIVWTQRGRGEGAYGEAELAAHLGCPLPKEGDLLAGIFAQDPWQRNSPPLPPRPTSRTMPL
jgi:peroxiredoxin